MKFEKGAPRHLGAGRKKGVPNKMTIELREAILQAVDQSGNEIVPGGGRTAYLAWLAKTQPASFATLLGKLYPFVYTPWWQEQTAGRSWSGWPRKTSSCNRGHRDYPCMISNYGGWPFGSVPLSSRYFNAVYFGALFYVAATSLVLGSWWGLATVPLVALGFAIRIRVEEKALREGLRGYGDYARHVRWRLIPFIW